MRTSIVCSPLLALSLFACSSAADESDGVADSTDSAVDTRCANLPHVNGVMFKEDTQKCLILSCADGWMNRNANESHRGFGAGRYDEEENGCETSLEPWISNPAPGVENLGTLNGDSGNGRLMVHSEGNRRYRVRVNETDSSIGRKPLRIQITATTPERIRYRFKVSLARPDQSHESTCLDSVPGTKSPLPEFFHLQTIQIDDRAMANDSFDLYVDATLEGGSDSGGAAGFDLHVSVDDDAPDPSSMWETTCALP